MFNPLRYFSVFAAIKYTNHMMSPAFMMKVSIPLENGDAGMTNFKPDRSAIRRGGTNIIFKTNGEMNRYSILRKALVYRI